MPLYYFHLHEGDDRLADIEGIELSSVGAVPDVALLQARDLLAGDIRDGKLGLRLRLEVTDEHGDIVHRLHFVDALTIDWPRLAPKSALDEPT